MVWRWPNCDMFCFDEGTVPLSPQSVSDVAWILPGCKLPDGWDWGTTRTSRTYQDFFLITSFRGVEPPYCLGAHLMFLQFSNERGVCTICGQTWRRVIKSEVRPESFPPYMSFQSKPVRVCTSTLLTWTGSLKKLGSTLTMHYSLLLSPPCGFIWGHQSISMFPMFPPPFISLSDRSHNAIGISRRVRSKRLRTRR